MLVLTRKHQEKIRIGNDIVITVLRTKGKAVRLGIEAPNTVPVVRGELTFDEGTAGIGSPDEFSLGEREVSIPEAANRLTRVATPAPESAWPANDSLNPARSDRPTESQVSLRKVPREKLAEVLPRLASGAGPLRSMLEQRSST